MPWGYIGWGLFVLMLIIYVGWMRLLHRKQTNLRSYVIMLLLDDDFLQFQEIR
jgi:hypothetical protein